MSYFNYLTPFLILLPLTALFSIKIYILVNKRTRERKEIKTEDDTKKPFAAKSEDQLCSIFRVAPIGIGVVTDRIFTKVNLYFCNMLGYSEEELLGRQSMFLYPDQEEYERIGKEKYKQITESGTGTVETRFKRKDGSIIDVILSSTPIDLEDFSKGVTFSVLDITERKKAEEEHKKLTMAIEQSMDAVVITKPDGSIEYVNNAFINNTGYTFSEVKGQNPRILKSGEHDSSFYQNLWNTISIKQTWRGRIINRKKDGVLYTEENTISPVIDEAGNIINFVAIKRDISSLLKFEDEKNQLAKQYQQAQKAESVGRLAGGIAHDLNNLLSPILGYCELLKDDFTPEDPVSYKLDKIFSAGIKAKDLVHQLLAFSRKQALKFELTDINNIITDFESLLKSTIREDIKIQTIRNENIPQVKADKGQIEQVIINLAINSQDAMPKGGKLIIETGISELDGDYATFHRGSTKGSYAVLIVSDTGTGIPSHIQDQIFEPFFSTKGENGTGLGLATVYGIIKQHGGNIWVYSEENRGTTFKIYLPAAKTEEYIENEPEDLSLSE
ncbi:MAG: PAS domain S-box protein [Spirochaetales bacterium]|nr:PAS domain S-box protein [Spirochaetales bacterium]